MKQNCFDVFSGGGVFYLLDELFAKFARCHTVFSFELAVEVADIVEAYGVGNACDLVICVTQLPSRNG